MNKEKLFKNEYLGVPYEAPCAMTDGKKHCPDKPEIEVEHNGNKYKLCKRCFQNYEEKRRLAKNFR